MSSIICSKTNIRVSSVLNRDVKQFGKTFLVDNKEETCWNSDQGSPQYVILDFPSPVRPTELHLKFQGGFVGQRCSLEGVTAEDGSSTEWSKIDEFHPKDVNSLQTFAINCQFSISRLRIVFDASTDFFGRVTIYKLDVLGHCASNDASVTRSV